MTNLNHEIFLFNRQDQPIKRLSRAASVDLYRNGKYVDGIYFPVSWTNAKKSKLIEKLIFEDIKKERLQSLKKKNTRKYRQEVLSLPEDWDIKLLGSDGKIISFGQLSKAKGFKLYQKDSETNRFKLKSTWELPRVSDRVDVKKELIFEAYERETIESPLPLEIDIEDTLDEIQEGFIDEMKERQKDLPEYESWTTKSDDFMAFGEILGFAKYRKMRLTEDYPIEYIGDRISLRQKTELSRLFDREWRKEWKRSKGSSLRFNAKLAINYYDSNGDLITQVDPITGEISPMSKWINTPRRVIRDVRGGQSLLSDLVVTLEKSFEGYINAVSGAVAVIGQIEIETLYLY